MATLLKGDCLKIMAGLPDKSVDCFICDLPYGQLSTKKASPESIKKYKRTAMFGGGDGACAWDIKIDIVEFWAQVKRLCKTDHTPVLMFCNTKFGYELIKSNEAWFRYDLVWDKNHGVSFLSANKMPMKSHEMVYVFSKKGAFYRRVNVDVGKTQWSMTKRDPDRIKSKQYGVSRDTAAVAGATDGKRCPLSVIPIAGTFARGGHPTEKPLKLYTWLLERYVPDNGTVLDPTAGSFNSILAARALGYKAIGIEMDTNFFWRGVAKLK